MPNGDNIVLSTSPGATNAVSTIDLESWGVSPTAHILPSLQTISLSEQLQPVNPSLNKRPEMKSDEQYYNRRLDQVVVFKGGKQAGEVGLEIECEGTNLFRSPFSYWNCHSDGSLRAVKGHDPCEYVLKVPLQRQDLEDALNYLNQKLKESGSEVIQSQRTSVHVHVNCQKMTVRSLYCYLCLYLIFEEILVEWSGPDRAGNLFCLRAKDSDYYVNMLESVLKQKNFKQWRDDYRYSACNVASIPKFGSLEFRSMKGTVDIETILTWVDILLHLKRTSEKYDSPVEIVDDFVNLGPLPFFKKTFGDKYRLLFEGIPGLSGKLWDGLRMMRDVAHSCEWLPPLPKKKRQKKVKNTE